MYQIYIKSKFCETPVIKYGSKSILKNLEVWRS
jgi:hypothetical protein